MIVTVLRPHVMWMKALPS
uniref:Uncharacterized protein n=1 Tax=Anguilla anguilla TaxID=7936 RepID=A0A0E9SDS6_ANGAN